MVFSYTLLLINILESFIHFLSTCFSRVFCSLYYIRLLWASQISDRSVICEEEERTIFNVWMVLCCDTCVCVCACVEKKSENLLGKIYSYKSTHKQKLNTLYCGMVMLVLCALEIRLFVKVHKSPDIVYFLSEEW